MHSKRSLLFFVFDVIVPPNVIGGVMKGIALLLFATTVVSAHSQSGVTCAAVPTKVQGGQSLTDFAKHQKVASIKLSGSVIQYTGSKKDGHD